jgi:glycerol-3-phosphate dehydrogenase
MLALQDRATDVDVIVIGGGVNGTGVARDCALRGLRVGLFERNDIAFGASGNSSGMIHGGPRYLSLDPDITRISSVDSGYIQRIAPHLLFRIPFLVPVFSRRNLTAKIVLTGYDAFFEAYDRYQPLKRGKPHVLLTAQELRELEPGLVESHGGVSFDEWGIDGVRLCIANLVDALEHGAKAHNHTTVTEVFCDERRKVRGVRYTDRKNQRSGICTASIVVNATGAWAPLTATLAGLGSAATPIRPGKGIHVFMDRRLTNYAILATAIDGRQVFMLPWQNMSVIGTTDDDFYGNLDEVVATADEVRYLLQAIESVFPAVRTARAIGTWGGVRPTLAAWGLPEDVLSREHRIVDHGPDGADGLYSMIGGKLASYRIFAEEMSDVVAVRCGIASRSQTHTLALPGGEEAFDTMQLVARSGIEPVTAARLAYRHGSRSQRILERMLRDPHESAVVCSCEPVTIAEVRHVVDSELAVTVDDVARRTRLGLGACGGMRCAARCGRIVAEATGRSPEAGLKMALEFLEAARRRRLPALGPIQARQEALALGVLRAELGAESR